MEKIRDYGYSSPVEYDIDDFIFENDENIFESEK